MKSRRFVSLNIYEARKFRVNTPDFNVFYYGLAVLASRIF